MRTMNWLISVSIEPQGNGTNGLDRLRLDATIEELTRRHTGNFLGSNTSKGTIDFAYEVEDEIVGKTKAMLVVEKRFPGHVYKIEATPLNLATEFALKRDNKKSTSTEKSAQRAIQSFPNDFGKGM